MLGLHLDSALAYLVLTRVVIPACLVLVVLTIWDAVRGHDDTEG